MADEDKIGRPWANDELDAIVTDYFSMLCDELNKRRYVKSHHSAALMERIGRTHRSVEFKHQNISAVLQDLGLPWIQGYKPKRNYQNAIFDAIDRYLTEHDDSTAYTVQPTVDLPESQIFVDQPRRGSEAERPDALERLLKKFDPVERDFRNRSLGKAGEAFVLDVERRKLARANRFDLVSKIRWVSKDCGDGAGYDILSFGPTGQECLIGVKTTNGAAKTPFFLTRTEHEVSKARAESWRLFRVHLCQRRSNLLPARRSKTRPVRMMMAQA